MAICEYNKNCNTFYLVEPFRSPKVTFQKKLGIKEIMKDKHFLLQPANQTGKKMLISQNMRFQISLTLAQSVFTLWKSQCSAPCLLVCIGVRVILLPGDFLSSQLSANHTADAERKWKRGNSWTAVQRPQTRRPPQEAIPLHHSNEKKDVQHTSTQTKQTKAMRLKKKKSPNDTRRWDENTATRSVRQRLGLTIMVSTWMNSWREASCVSLNSLRMLKRSTSLLETMMRISALSSVPRPWWWEYFYWRVANIKTQTEAKHVSKYEYITCKSHLRFVESVF